MENTQVQTGTKRTMHGKDNVEQQELLSRQSTTATYYNKKLSRFRNRKTKWSHKEK